MNLSVEQLQETVAFLSHSAMKALEQVQQVSIANQQLAQAHQQAIAERDALKAEVEKYLPVAPTPEVAPMPVPEPQPA